MMRTPRREKRNRQREVARRCQHSHAVAKKKRSLVKCGGKTNPRKKKKKIRSHCANSNSNDLAEVVMQFSRKQMVCIELRKVQLKSGCSTLSLNLALEALKPYVQFPLPKVQEADAFIKRISGANVIRLHGCATKDCPTIWTPEDDQECCSLCGANR